MKQFKVKQAFGTYAKGDLISPTGLYRDHLQSYDYIEKHPFVSDDSTAPATAPLDIGIEPESPVPPCDDDDIADDIDEDDDDDSPLIETAEAPHGIEAVMQKRGRGRPRRV